MEYFRDQQVLVELTESILSNINIANAFADQIKNIRNFPQELKDVFNKFGYVESGDINDLFARSDDIDHLTKQYLKTKDQNALKQIEAILNHWKVKTNE